MKVSVIQDDIDRGCRGTDEDCPVARAFKRKGYVFVSVLPGNVMLKNNKGMEFYGDLPQEVSDFIHDFDATETGEPFEFEIELEEHS